ASSSSGSERDGTCSRLRSEILRLYHPPTLATAPLRCSPGGRNSRFETPLQRSSLLLGGWPLELDDVAFGIVHVDRRAFALGAVTRFRFARVDAGIVQLLPDRAFVERLDAQAEMIEIATLDSRRGAAGAAELAGDRHEIDQRAARTQLDEAKRVDPALDGHAEHAAVERQHRVDVDYAQHQMVDLANANHR